MGGREGEEGMGGGRGRGEREREMCTIHVTYTTFYNKFTVLHLITYKNHAAKIYKVLVCMKLLKYVGQLIV